MKNLNYDDEVTFSTSLISLSQIAKLQPQVFATKYKHVIKDFIVSKLMTVDRVCMYIYIYNTLFIFSNWKQANKEYIEGDKEWAGDDEISYEAKMKASKDRLYMEAIDNVLSFILSCLRFWGLNC